MPFYGAIVGRFAVVRDDLELPGEVIGANNLLIASIALAHDLVPATDDSAFGRVTGRHIEDWTVANVSRSVIMASATPDACAGSRTSPCC